MSEENVELVWTAMKALNQRDRAAWLAVHDPAAEFRADPEWPVSATVAGRGAVWDFSVDLADAWERDDLELVEFVDAGDHKVAAHYRRPVKGKTRGIADGLDYWCVHTFREGLICRDEWFATRAAALEAAGLSE
jgi:ketosteroid isomerase-like protein